MKILAKIKRKSVLIGILFTMLIIGIVYAADSYQVNSGTQVTIDEHTVCKKVTNNNALAIFVPTKTADEWTAFRTNASGVSITECCNANGLACSSDADCCSGICKLQLWHTLIVVIQIAEHILEKQLITVQLIIVVVGTIIAQEVLANIVIIVIK